MLTFELVTLGGVKLSAEIYEVRLPTPQGQIGILPHHIPLVSLISVGVISVRHHQDDPDERLEHFASLGGVVEIDGKRVRVLTDEAEHADDIDELVARKALEKALELRHSAQDHVALADAMSVIERNSIRLKVTELKKRRRL